MNQRISKQRKQRQARLYQQRTGPLAAQEAWLENVSPSTAGLYLAAKGLCWWCTSIWPRNRVAWFMPDFKAYNASINLLVPPFAYQDPEDHESSDAMLSSSNHDHRKAFFPPSQSPTTLLPNPAFVSAPNNVLLSLSTCPHRLSL